MKISYVLMQYPLPTQTFAISDISALREMGHEVDVECLLPATKRQRDLAARYSLTRGDIHNARIGGYALGVFTAVKYVYQNPMFFFSIFRELASRPIRLGVFAILLPRICELVRRLSKNPPDVVHAFWGHWPSVVPALLRRYAPCVRTSVHMGAYDLYAGFPLRLTADEVSYRFTHSVSNLPRIRDMGVSGEVQMIHRGVPLADLSSLDDRGLPIEKRQLQFCTASSLSRAKNVDVVLRIYAIVRQSHPGAQLIIVGDGEDRRRLERLAEELGIADSVSFRGYLKRQDLFKVMCSSEYFLFFSTKVSERLPNVVKEAMLAKCLCFVSDTKGIEELLPDPAYGYVLPDLEHERVAEQILKSVEDRFQAERIGENARLRVIEHFSSESAMSMYLDCWGRDP